MENEKRLPNETKSPVEPGRLEGSQVEFLLHTLEASSIVHGRKADRGHRIIGLEEFNKRSSIVFNEAAQGDPFADEALKLLEHKYRSVEKELESIREKLVQALQGRVRITEGESSNPVVYKMRLSRYGTQAAELISLFDEVALIAHNANHHNRIPMEEMRKRIARGRGLIRSLFSVLMPYRVTKVTRKDLAQKNQHAQQAIFKLVESYFLDLSKYEGDWGKAAEAYSGGNDRPLFGPPIKTERPDSDIPLNTEQAKSASVKNLVEQERST